MRIFIRLLTAVIIGMAGLSGCDDGGALKTSVTSRANKELGSGPIVIGVLTSAQNHDSIQRGMQLALKEINERSTFQNQPMQVQFYLQPASPDNEMGIVQKIAKNDRTLAVINGLTSRYTSATDRILLTSNILHILVANTSASVTVASPLSFRIISNDRITSKKILANLERRWRNIAVVHERSEMFVSQAKSFIESAAESDIHISHSISYFSWEKDIRQLLWSLRENANKNQDLLDAIYIACNVSDSVSIINQIRSMNIRVPIVSSVELDDIAQLQAAGTAANGVVMASYFNPDAPHPATKDFIKRFQAKYPNNQPDIWAARAYVTLSMLATSIESAKTINAWEVASELLLPEKWYGATGTIIFGIEGDVQKHAPIYLKQYCNGQFHFLTEDQPIPLCPP
jgi:branched-chain amino acid transport system substrate-binding protein